MSTIQTNSITDAAGTGAPDFPNGINAATALIAKVDETERMRIDSSGNVLVGKTSANTTITGVEARPDGLLVATRDLPTASSDTVSIFDRRTTDGDVIRVRQDGSTVGAIGASGTRIYFARTGDCGIKIGSSGINPTDGDGANADNQFDLGSLSVRWDDVYATNGTIITSDRNEKQDIEELNDAERRVAVACKGLMRKYRWISSVAEKGDDARIHFGIIAQDLQAAFAAEGLDAGRYAMFIHSTWTDEETGEERSRMGVRYSELLAFIIAAL